MIVEQPDFLELCRAVQEGAETDLSDKDRELLLVLHRALTGLKDAVEKALLGFPVEGRTKN
jgi:hypothetical protein